MQQSKIEVPLPAVPRVARVWHVRDAKCDIPALARAIGRSETLATILSNRGVTDPEEARGWLQGTLKDLPDPRDLVDMDVAVDRLLRAIREGELICIHGDYDVDGCTSTVLLVRFLREIGGNVTWYAPHRLRDGYGVQVHTMRRLAEEGVKVVVTCDNGVSAHEPIAVGNALGIDTVVCDHHKLPPELPAATAILNPKQDGEGNPHEELAAVGVAFMLAIAMRARLRSEGAFEQTPEPDLRKYLDVVALGTVADLAPLRGVNRILVAAGLRRLERRERPGMRMLLKVAGVGPDEPIRASHLGFRLGPRINAAGRIDESSRAVDLLLAEDDDAALPTAIQLDEFNRKRQEMERETFSDVLRMAAEAGDFQDRRGLVVWSEAWHPGVVGIVASRLVHHFHRPTLVLALKPEEGVAVGSGRAIAGVDLFEELQACGHLLERFGGHRAAAGMTVTIENLPALRDHFAVDAFGSVSEDDWKPRLAIDRVIDLNDVTWDLFEDLACLRPFGLGNPEPVFTARDLTATGVRTMRKGGIRMRLRSGDGRPIPAVGFGLGMEPEDLEDGVDAVFSLHENIWQGRSTLELRLRDIRPSRPPEQVGDQPKRSAISTS
jgi:single-stranded-DNA-specific exonuclease